MVLNYVRFLALCLIGLSLFISCAAPPAGEDGSGAKRAQLVPVGPFIEVDMADRSVALQATTCLGSGWLEQVVCGVGTREHESLLATSARASDLHAALLLVGFKSGTPGHWRVGSDGSVIAQAPTGELLELTLAWTDNQGASHQQPVGAWISQQENIAIDHEWVFAGSKLALPPGQSQGQEVYYADESGSLVGLVTFGDEVVAHRLVIPDKADVAAPIWSVNEQVVPEPGTAVKVFFRAAHSTQ